MRDKAYCGRLINFMPSFELEYFPLGILIINEYGRIVEYGELRRLYKKYRNKISHIENFGENIIMPGFVETHIHLSHYGFPIEEEKLEQWLKVIYEEEEKLKDKEYARTVARSFFDYLISNGITTACIHASYYKEATEIAFEEAQKLGLTAIIGMVMVDSDDNLPENLKKYPEKSNLGSGGNYKGLAQIRKGFILCLNATECIVM